MKKGTYLFTIWILCLSTIPGLQAQTCTNGELNPQVAAFIKMMPEDNRSVEQLRKTTNFAEYKRAGPPPTPYPKESFTRILITKDSIPVLVYNPSKAKGLPIIITYHGGGFIQPILPYMEYRFWYDANFYNAVVFAVDYRVAPEHKFPTPVNDAYSAFKWISEHGGEFGGDTNRIAVSGISAGANFVAVVCQKAKQEGIAHKIKLQVMNSPELDSPNRINQYPSMKRNAKGYFFTTAAVLFALETYADPKDYNNPALAPMLFKDLSGLPPAVIITAQFDPLRDQGAAYAARLRKAGVKVWYQCVPGQIHGLIPLPPEAPEYKQVDTLVLTAMKEVMKL